jgi:hypothetical protein
MEEGDAARQALEHLLPGAQPEGTKVGCRPAYRAISGDGAALVVVRGSEVWLLQVSSPDPGAWLEKVAATLEL